MRPSVWTLLLAAALAAGCGEQELYSGLTQRQANEMTAALRNAGIDADKRARDGGFVVSAPKAAFAQAVAVLRASGLPREGYDTLGQVFKKEGFVSSPLEERARLVHALSQEISNTVASIDGVVMARVHLAVPARDPLSDRQVPASASVFIKHRPGVDLSARQGQIKALVVNAIEGLPYDNVTVALFAAEPLAARAPEEARSPLGGLPWLLGSLAALGLALAAAGGGWLGWQRWRGAAAGRRTAALTTLDDVRGAAS
jgi:type III secretion protein J